MKKFIVSLAVTLCVLASAGTVFAAENEPVLNTQSVPDVSSDTQVSDQIAIVYKDNGNIGDLGLTTGEVKEATSVSDKV
ncbi:MAG: hypothetical protein PHN26_06970, partial [Eubacteriaceae bacterium]|nr:hypothetical protein [Eubacteriaceae bacterium]